MRWRKKGRNINVLLKEVRFFRERVKQNVRYEIRTVSVSVCVCVQDRERKKIQREGQGEREHIFDQLPKSSQFL